MCSHRGVLLYKKKYGCNNRWQYCDNSKTDILAPDLPLPEVIDALKSEDIKKKSDTYSSLTICFMKLRKSMAEYNVHVALTTLVTKF